MSFRNTVTFCVYGDYAMFSDPVTRVGGEKLSYQVPTYEALKGILMSVYWKPTIIWIIDKVRIINPIQTETKSILVSKYTSMDHDLSYYTYLRNVKYQVEAHFIWNENRPELAEDRNENKHWTMAKHAIKAGGRRDVFLGTRECSAYVEPCEFGSGEGYYDNIPELSYGNMYHGITYPDEATKKEQEWFSQQKNIQHLPGTGKRGGMSVRLWNCVMKKGVIEFIQPEDCIHRAIREVRIKKFNKDNVNLNEEMTTNAIEGGNQDGAV